MWASLFEQGHWHGEIWEPAQEWRGVSRMAEPVGGARPQWVLSHYVGLFLICPERKAAEARAEYLIHHDPLTDLPNRLQAKTA